jgi:NH3-dependent NAD+ synthetase
MAENSYHDFEQAKADGIQYMLAVGRRQPMHQGHLRTVQKIMDQGFTPIVVIGSTNNAKRQNGLDDPLFEPLANPLTAEQQREQIKRALAGKVEGKDYHLIEFPDLGDTELWNRTLVEKLKGQIEIDGKYPDLLGKTAFHFIGKPEDRRPRRLADASDKEVLAYYWEETLQKLGLPVLTDVPHEEVSYDLSATQLRSLDLNKLRASDRALFADPDYIIAQANAAREANPDKEHIRDMPVTLFDLTLQRLAQEKNISTKDILNAMRAEGDEFTLESMQVVAKRLNGSMKKIAPTVPLKIASASLNQTVYDFATNVPNIMQAIDKAVEDGADVLSLEELGLTGYAADDYHQWNKNNDEVWKHIQLVARYANKKNPNLIISLGTPWHYADKTADASDTLYNLSNRPYNSQFTISGGKVLAIAAKSILADGAAEYEPRQFRHWPAEKGTITITLPDGSHVPFGKPIVAFGEESKRFTLTHEICAEGWPGVGDDLSINNREQQQARHIAKLSRTHDLSVVLNPSASKPQPAINKEKIRADGLCKEGSKYCGAFVYTNYLGSASGTYAAEGSQLFAQDGKIIHHGQRYHFGDVSYSSAVIDIPLAERGNSDAVAPHVYHPHTVLRTGAEAPFEKVAPENLAFEEYARSISLWLRDYMRKQSWPCQGFVISLSGGKDSAYGAIAISMMVDLEVQENGVEGFFEHFPKLAYKDEVLRINREQGPEAAVAAIKKNLLTCVYEPTDNSSKRTRDAARYLIEGGTLVEVYLKDEQGNNRISASGEPITQQMYFDEKLDAINGNQFTKWKNKDSSETFEIKDIKRDTKGIGGNFYVASVQRALDELIIAYSGLNINDVAHAHREAVIEGMEHSAEVKEAVRTLPVSLQHDLAAAQIVETIRRYVNAPKGSNPTLPDYIASHCVKPIPTWSNPEDDTTLQNFQARVRVPTPWAVANKENKIALVTSNASEAILGYTTAGGDMHMGGANLIGGMPKSKITKSLKYFEQHGLSGFDPVAAVHLVNNELPSAELRKEVVGEAPQTDEADLRFNYDQAEIIAKFLIEERNTPAEVFARLRTHPEFPKAPPEIQEILRQFTVKRWEGAQFKRVFGALATHLGSNVDPHQAVRTTVLGDHFRTGMAQLTLDVMAEKLGGEDRFQRAFNMDLNDASQRAALSRDFKELLLSASVAELLSPERRSELQAAAKKGKAVEAHDELTPAPVQGWARN